MRTTSMSGTRRWMTACPSELLRSMAIPRLLRLREMNVRLSLGANCPVRRHGSPVTGSTLMMSAPRSPRCIPANGAAIISENSRMRTPASGPSGIAVQRRRGLHPAQLHPHRRHQAAGFVSSPRVVPDVLGLRTGADGDHFVLDVVALADEDGTVVVADLDGAEQPDGLRDRTTEVAGAVAQELDHRRGRGDRRTPRRVVDVPAERLGERAGVDAGFGRTPVEDVVVPGQPMAGPDPSE